ncbi:hypothetical protein HY626_04470 [Candidatus Uhrbacteria bacterium]|nr:hypothetical protein [Candidatus Uhrbacteria bacterium]
MIWYQKMFKPLEAITRTGFLVSLTSYIVFWLADVVQPGFVSRYFSVHIFLLATVVFGILWSMVLEEYEQRPLIHILLAITFGVVLAVLTWGLAADLGVYRVPLVLLTALTPMILYALMRDSR